MENGPPCPGETEGRRRRGVGGGGRSGRGKREGKEAVDNSGREKENVSKWKRK